MTEQRYRNAAAAPPEIPRHRRDGGAGVTAWLPAADRRGILVGAGALTVVLVLIVGYLLLGRAGDPPPTDTGAQPGPGVNAPPPTADPTPTSPAPATGTPGSSEPGIGGSGPAGQPDRTSEPPEDATRTSAPPQRAPRRVGPSDLDGFEKLLVDFCKARQFRTALLLNGPDNSPRTGNWVCTQVVTFENLNLNDACQKSFGPEAQARQTQKGDARTWRCYDS